MTADDRPEEFIEAFDELTAAQPMSRKPIDLDPNTGGPVAVFPGDENKVLVASVNFNGWGTPSGADGESITWRDQWMFVGSYNRWFRVIYVENNSSSRQRLLVTIQTV